ncbi:MAG: hypothetical protein E7596_02080 [Ruminococcaceae bacterium]|nr:hypothetical protein [Oscillospiraceae bacterium]
MLSVFEKGIVELIKCALKGGVPQLDEGFDFEEAYQYAQDRQITPIIYYGASNIPDFMDTMVGKKFFKSTMNLSFFSMEQGAAIDKITTAFKNNKIHHVKLKGTITRDMYPYPEMRLMSDADILIKMEEYDKIKEIMLSTGAIEERESNHEIIWRYGEFSIELHKLLIPSYNKDYYEYFGNGWRLATLKDEETNECFMTPEDSFIYMLVHFAKHYRDSGISVKHLTDFYVYTSKNPDLDFEYIEKELSKLMIADFWKNIKRTLEAWFDGAEWDEKSVFITKKVISSLTYGSSDNRTLARAIKASKTTKHVKLKKVMGLIFPTYFSMSQKYPVLKKVPVLLPIMWVVRWFEAIFNPSKIKNQKRHIDMISEESVGKYHDELNYVGLDFNFQ